MPFEFRMLDAEHPEDGAELEKRWPLKRFPVLLDGERLVAEASIIVEYVNQRAPERADADSGRCRRRYRGALAPGRPRTWREFDVRRQRKNQPMEGALPSLRRG
jgi:glutathione S-transferase